ncbi:MAG: dUTP diphosphatase [archaeon]
MDAKLNVNVELSELRKAIDSAREELTFGIQHIPVDVKRLHKDAIIPYYAHDGDAGFDFFTIEDLEIQSDETKLVKTGLSMAIPNGFEIQVRPRSGLSLNTGLIITNSPGTVDSTYRGEIGIIVRNTADETITLDKGSKIAQGVLKKVPVAYFREVDELPETERGTGGFGSTGG